MSARRHTGVGTLVMIPLPQYNERQLCIDPTVSNPVSLDEYIPLLYILLQVPVKAKREVREMSGATHHVKTRKM